jgi:hypothetical protein
MSLERFMSSRSHPVLFEVTRSALLLPRPTEGGIRAPVDQVDFSKSNLDKNFWILRELGKHLVLIEHGVELSDLGRYPEGIPI